MNDNTQTNQQHALIERYIYALTKRLPHKIRQDVELEMRANIMDMLSDQATEEEVRSVLLSLGSPKKMATSFYNQEHYVISPAIFYLYWDVLKLVLTIVAILAGIGVFFNHILPIFSASDFTTLILLIPSFIINSIIRIFSSVLPAFGLVTLIFAAIEYFGGFKKIDESWSLDDLPDVPKSRPTQLNLPKEIIVTVITALFMSALFIALRFPESAYYTLDNGMNVFILVPNNYSTYFTYFMLMVPFYLITRYLYISAGQWNKLNSIINTVYQVSFALIILSFINDPRFLSPGFITTLAVESGNDLTKIVELISTLMRYVSVGVIIATIVDVFTPIRQAYINSKRDA